MRKPLVLYVLCFALALTGCVNTPKSRSSAKNVKHGEVLVSYNIPHHHRVRHDHVIAIYPEATALKRPYRVIGKETISRYNFIGLERQSKTVDELMKSLAASMGGDAVINISADQQKVEATVISYEKVLL